MTEANWYVVHTYSGYENKVKANIDKTIENRHLEDQILEVRVPLEDVTAVSYTHLDVYKRQVEYSLTCIAWMILILYIIKVLNLKNKTGID